MKYLIFIGTGLVLLMVIFIFLTRVNSINNSPDVTINGKHFNAEIAKTENQKAVGLAKYNNIQNDFMMVFPFEKEGYYSFWMKDMKFSIDIIFVRKNKIIDVFKNVPHPKSGMEKLAVYKPAFPADTVLEINAGLCDKYNFKKGDSIAIEY